MRFGIGSLLVLGIVLPFGGRAVGATNTAAAASLSSANPGTDSTTSLRPWNEYQVFMWLGDSFSKQPDKIPLAIQRFREMGISAGMVYGQASPKPLLDNQFPYYVENVVNRGLCLKFNSKVTDWDKFVTDWAKNGRPDSAFVRDYCLDSPEWLAYAAREMVEAATRNAPHQPLAYDIRDELSTTISANPFDYDFNPITLEKFREWLRGQYGDLKDLNRAWSTKFVTWEMVTPFSTDQIKERMAHGSEMPMPKTDWHAVQSVRFEPAAARRQPRNWNLSPWCDFRTHMDRSLAGALDHIRQAARSVDPTTPVGIEGTQMPHAFGGYDLWRLSQAIDWVEPYDIGSAREIFGSFMPGKTLMTTVFEKTTESARRRLWHLLLEGDRGCLIWWSEDCLDWKSGDYALTPKARSLAPVLVELRGPLARLFLRATRERDPVYIHYSQASIQVNWLIESTVDGSTWPRRFSSFEADHNRMAKVRNSWLKAFQDLGFSPVFVSSPQIEAGRLDTAPPNAIVVLPTSTALSDKEATALKRFCDPEPDMNAASAPQRRIFFDGHPGAFNEHGKLRPEPAIAELGDGLQGVGALRSGRLVTREGDFAKYQSARTLASPEAIEWQRWIATNLGAIKPPVEVDASAATRVHRFTTPRARLLAFERNINYQMSEDLKQAGGNEGLERPVEIRARIPQAAHVYELWSGKYLGELREWSFRLDPWRPALFALTRTKLDAGDITAALE